MFSTPKLEFITVKNLAKEKTRAFGKIFYLYQKHITVLGTTHQLFLLNQFIAHKSGRKNNKKCLLFF
jgi:hypothetical protein